VPVQDLTRRCVPPSPHAARVLGEDQRKDILIEEEVFRRAMIPAGRSSDG
jgi:hypothetical protein